MSYLNKNIFVHIRGGIRVRKMRLYPVIFSGQEKSM